ncbi:hypothetical protein [Chryseobacterium carnipullorum]|uniref:hypothetical protein n=1 Tax=Chryseobacterium carnipullorum TaxID=1124835 RepID=UPI001E4710A0|nr:hypothetical protein [Chryseobacterium carnipullorum]
MNPIQEYFYRIDEPERSTLLFLRQKILESDTEYITETLSFGLPFLSIKRKCCATSITVKNINSIM